MRITAKGQVTIPQHIRESAGFLPCTEVDFVVSEGGVMLVKADSSGKPSRGQKAINALVNARPYFTMTTDELMALTRGDD
jgi:AbrB family looped-hinge helix DNA binding protein